MLSAAVRSDLAAVPLFAYVFVSGVDWRPNSRFDWRHVLVDGVFTVGAHHVLLFGGRDYVLPATAAVLLGPSSVITPAFTSLLATGGGLSARGYVSVLLGFAGFASSSVGRSAANSGANRLIRYSE